jgi:SPASM domain peptide maturase of grasp-with-spasm system
MLENPNNYLKLFASCVLVKGVQRSTICDLQRNKYHFIPNSLYEILSEYKDLSTVEILLKFEDFKDRKIIIDYFNFLIKNELAFVTPEPDLFPEIEKVFHQPSIISNSILDIGLDSPLENLEKYFQDLTILGCKALELRFFVNVSNETIELILKETKNSSLNSIELLLPFNSKREAKWANKILKNHKRVCSIIFHSSKKEEFNYNEKNKCFVGYIKKKVDSAMCCGNVRMDRFAINIPHFMESLNFNSCLNKKISLDEFGQIKNCPSSSIIYGNIKATSIIDVVANPNFRKLWNINKDQITICKDCEFRYICTDCRIFINDTNDIFSKPSKCNYDPYTTKWIS